MTNVDDADREVLLGDLSAEERAERLTTGAALAGRPTRTSLLANPRFLMGLASLLMTTGIMAIILGWVGASRSIRTQEQIPYLISGGLLGVALAIVGALTLFTHWLTVLVRDNRRHHRELVETIREAMAAQALEAVNGTAPRRQAQRPLRRDARRS
jgi:uncharacterized membrane protein